MSNLEPISPNTSLEIPQKENSSSNDNSSFNDDPHPAPQAYTVAHTSARDSRQSIFQKRFGSFDGDLEADIQSLRRPVSHQSIFPDLDEQTALSKVLAERPSLSENGPIPSIGAGRPMPPPIPDTKLYQVDFDGPDDIHHPFNWTTKHKFKVAVPITLCAFVSAWGSSVFSVAIDTLSEKFHVKPVVIELGVSFYVLGYASGPTIWSPLSEVYGRKPTLILAMFLFVCFIFATATAQNLQTLLICRFFSGMSGSAPLTIVAAIFADMFPIQSRGKAIDVFSSTFLCGPLLAPIAGGFIVTSYLGWRWLLYLTGIMGGAVFLALVLLMEETYTPIILVGKAEKLRELTGNWGIHAAHESVKLDFHEIVTKTISRPLRMLITEPILLLLSVYNGFCYAILYLTLSSYPYTFMDKYKWTLGLAMLPYLGILIGMMTCGLLMMACYEREYVRIKTVEETPSPETRLKPMMPAGIVFAIGIFFFFWSANYPHKVNWAVPTVAGLFMGYGIFGVLVASINYVVDCYLFFAASAVAGLTLLRSLMGSASPLFATYMFEGIGLNWSGLLIGCVALIMAPVPFLFYYYGDRLRRMSKFAFE